MEPLRYCTLTGADESTDIDRMVRISEENPIVEWGILFDRAMHTADGSGRYPRAEWIRHFVEKAGANSMNLALHLCGREAIDFISPPA